MEHIRIETIQNVFNTVNLENIDRFMLDFYKIFHGISKATEGIDKSDMKMTYFDWIDDGGNEITLNLESENGEFNKQIKY
jgi:hypothetical protein